MKEAIIEAIVLGGIAVLVVLGFSLWMVFSELKDLRRVIKNYKKGK